MIQFNLSFKEKMNLNEGEFCYCEHFIRNTCKPADLQLMFIKHQEKCDLNDFDLWPRRAGLSFSGIFTTVLLRTQKQKPSSETPRWWQRSEVRLIGATVTQITTLYHKSQNKQQLRPRGGWTTFRPRQVPVRNRNLRLTRH